MEEMRKARTLARAAQVNRQLAAWLEQELQDVDQAVAPTRSLLHGLGGTPTVLGLAETPPENGQAPAQGIVSAQIECSTRGHINAFGQACAARLYARRSYLVVHKGKRIEEHMHLHALCRMFGLGLVIFDNFGGANPCFRLAVHAVDHVPDPVYESRCLKQLGEAL